MPTLEELIGELPSSIPPEIISSTPASALGARGMRARGNANTRTLRNEYAGTAADSNLSDEGREKALAPLLEKLQASHDATTRVLMPLEPAAEKEMTNCSPAEVRRRAGAQEPAKATHAAELARLEDPKGLLSLARSAVEAKDDATARGLELAIRNREDIAPEEAAAILAVLDAPHLPRYELALATLVGIKTEIARHLLGGPIGDGFAAMSRDPAKALAANYAARTYATPGGESVTLSDAAAQKALDSVGVLKDIE